jgi:hypothetical protein
MSKPLKSILTLTAATTQILLFLYNSTAQTIEMRVTLDGTNAVIEGKISDGKESRPVTNFAVPDIFAGQTGLAARHSAPELASHGVSVGHRRLAPGEFLAESAFDSFRFVSDLKPLGPASMAHVSWISDARAIVTAADIVPEIGGTEAVTMTFEPPPGWSVHSNERQVAPNRFRINDPATAVFLLSKDGRFLTVRDGVNVVIDGDFLFTDSDAKNFVGEILDEYRTVFGDRSARRATVFVVRFPKTVPYGRWEAETRGSNVTILSADMPISTPSVQKLHEQLRHELFHLWMPNDLELSGSYDWFYEGFALYQSLRTGVSLNRLRFEDFLDTLARAADADSTSADRRSLLESSRNRWSGANSRIYARGMLVAFLIDIAMLESSGARESVADLLREVRIRHSKGKPSEDGNDAILRILEARPPLRPITARYVRSSEPLDLRPALAAAGIGSLAEKPATRLQVIAYPNRRQKAILNELGYNNWRNFLKKNL